MLFCLFVVLHDVRNGGDTEEEIKARIEKTNNIPSMVLWGREDQVLSSSI